jgi:hypothetical protein
VQTCPTAPEHKALSTEAWANPLTFAKATGVSSLRSRACPNSGANNVLWNAMIVPYTVGPMTVKGFTWFQVRRAALSLRRLMCNDAPSSVQGENNAGDATHYQCWQPAMVRVPINSKISTTSIDTLLSADPRLAHQLQEPQRVVRLCAAGAVGGRCRHGCVWTPF